MPSPLFRRKSLGSLISDSDDRGEATLKRSLGSYSLIALGLGAIVGYGALILTGILSARYAGPAILISIAVSSLIAILTGLCYAELATMVPIAGSAYIYAFATLGELPAWFVAWELLLEYSFGAAMVAWGWSGYFASLLRVLKISLPPYLSGCPWDTFVQYQGRWEEIGHILPALNATGVNVSSLSHQHGLINLPGSLVVLLFTGVLIIGITESARSNTLLVAVKLFIILFFIVAGVLFLANHPKLIATNLHPFVPQAIKFGQFGWSGVFRASAIFFVAFLGLDAVATSAEESKNPGKDVMTGIIGSVLISSVLFSLFALVLVSTMSYKNLDIADPLAVGMDNIGLHWGSILVTLGALGALSSTLVVMLLGASRILYSVSRDKLLPSFFSQIHPKYRTRLEARL